MTTTDSGNGPMASVDELAGFSVVDGERLRVEYVRLTTCKFWDRNPKLHDLSKLQRSFKLHGFKDPMKFEPTLNEGEGGTVEGNGRLETLTKMFDDDPGEPPRGVLLVIDEDGSVVDWAVPFLFGVDADSERAAQAYAIDHNNLTLRGSDLAPVDLERIYEVNDYHDLLADLVSGDDAVQIASLTDDEIQFYVADIEVPWLSQVEGEGSGAAKERDFVPLTINCNNWDAYDDLVVAVRQLLVEHPEWQARIV